MLWLTSVETSELVGLAISRIVMIEQKSAREGNVVAIFMESGKEVRVIETLGAVRAQLDANAPQEG